MSDYLSLWRHYHWLVAAFYFVSNGLKWHRFLVFIELWSAKLFQIIYFSLLVRNRVLSFLFMCWCICHGVVLIFPQRKIAHLRSENWPWVSQNYPCALCCWFPALSWEVHLLCRSEGIGSLCLFPISFHSSTNLVTTNSVGKSPLLCRVFQRLSSPPGQLYPRWWPQQQQLQSRRSCPIMSWLTQLYQKTESVCQTQLFYLWYF